MAIEDEKHAIMICPAYQNERQILFESISDEIGVFKWTMLSSDNKFILIMKIRTQPIKTGKFIHYIMNWDNLQEQ